MSCAAWPALMPTPPLPSSVVASVKKGGTFCCSSQTLRPRNDGLTDCGDETCSAQLALGAEAGTITATGRGI
jgi:hypothetical protein